MDKKIIFIIAILIMFAAGCTGGARNKNEEVDVHVGFSGLAIEFLKNSPPSKVFEGDTLPVLIKVKNNGAYSITGDRAIVSLGVEKDYTDKLDLLKGGRISSFAGLNNAAVFSLDGKSPISPVGDEEVISYNLKAGKVDPQSEAHASTVIATLCYPYETVLSSTVCIDTDINNLRPSKKVCSNKDLIFSNGQGAPVSVIKAEVNMLPMQTSEQKASEKIKPQFLIYIEDKGQGIVIRKEAVQNFCTKSDTSHENLNIVYVNAFLSGNPLKCQLDTGRNHDELGHIKLNDKKDIIFCELEGGISATQDPFLSPLKIELSYGYTQSISANYFIQKTAR